MVGLKWKSAEATKDAIRHLVENEMGQKPKIFFVDNGGEFRNRVVEQYLAEQNIEIQSPKVRSITKAAMVERFNRSLEDLIHRHFTAQQTRKYIDLLPAILKVYNNRRHRSLDLWTPEEAEREENQDEIFNVIMQRYNDLAQTRQLPKYKVGDEVYVVRPKEAFVRGYQERFYKEPCEITKVMTKMPRPMYEVRRLDNKQVFPRSLYEGELQPRKVLNEEYNIEKVIKTRKLPDGTKEHFVKWVGYGPEANSWVHDRDMTRRYDN